MTGESLGGESPAAEPAATDMQVAAAMCAGCHASGSDHAAGPETAIPAIDGLSASELSRMLVAFREGKRENPVMTLIAGAYSPEEISALAAILAAPAPELRND